MALIDLSQATLARLLAYLIWIPGALYLVGWLIEFVRFWGQHKERSRWGEGVIAVGWESHTILIALAIWYAAFDVSTNLIILAWLAIILNYFVYGKGENIVIRFIFPPFSIAMLIIAAFVSKIPAVSGPLPDAFYTSPTVLVSHIVSIIAGHLLFAMACAISIAYLAQERRLKAKSRPVSMRLPSLGSLEHLNHRAITLGFFFLTMGIILGLLVSGLGNLPHRLLSARQIIPTLTWLVYAAFLLAHDFRGWRGRFGAVWSVVGFVAVMASLVFEFRVLLG